MSGYAPPVRRGTTSTRLSGGVGVPVWMDRGSCTRPPASGWFWAVDDEDRSAYERVVAVELARRVCWGCPVVRACDAFAVAVRPVSGMWAGKLYVHAARVRGAAS